MKQTNLIPATLVALFCSALVAQAADKPKAPKQGKPKRQLDSSEPWATPSSTSGTAKPKRPLSSSPW